MTLLSMAAALSMVRIDGSGVSVALPAIQQALHLDEGRLQWIITSAVLTMAAGLAAGGRIGDIFGKVRVFVGGVILFLAGSLTCGFASSLWMLLSGRVVEGLGLVLMIPVASVLATGVFGPEQRGRATGIYTGISGVAMILAPMLAGVLSNPPDGVPFSSSTCPSRFWA